GGAMNAQLPAQAVTQAGSSGNSPPSAPTYFAIRSDDAGMSHSVNMGLEQLIETGPPVSVSVMFAWPVVSRDRQDAQATSARRGRHPSHAQFQIGKAPLG